MLSLELTERQCRTLRVLVMREGLEKTRSLSGLPADETGERATFTRVRELALIERKLTEALHGPSSKRQPRAELPGQTSLLDFV